MWIGITAWCLYSKCEMICSTYLSGEEKSFALTYEIIKCLKIAGFIITSKRHKLLQLDIH